MGVFSYGFLGDSSQQSITENFGRDYDLQFLPGALNIVMSASCAGLVALKLIVTLPLIVTPICLFAEEQLGFRDKPAPQILWKGLLMAVTTAVCVALKDNVV